MNSSSTEIEWSELIVVFNSLVRNIEMLRTQVESDLLKDDDLYDTEEELNDYTMLLARLRQRYLDIPDKGELSEALEKK